MVITFLACYHHSPQPCFNLGVLHTSAPAAAPHCLCLQPKPALVSISHIPTSSGRVYDAPAVGAAAAAAGVPFLLDACQSAGQMPLDVKQLQCDFLTGKQPWHMPRRSPGKCRVLEGWQVSSQSGGLFGPGTGHLLK